MPQLMRIAGEVVDVADLSDLSDEALAQLCLHLDREVRERTAICPVCRHRHRSFDLCPDPWKRRDQATPDEPSTFEVALHAAIKARRP